MVTHDDEWMEIIKEFGMDENSTDAIPWAKIRDELDKRSLPPTIDSISLSKVNVAADQDSHDHLQVRSFDKSSTASVTCLLDFT